MYVKMLKLEDNDTFVVYRFEATVWEKVLNGEKNEVEILAVKYGYCNFNKISEHFELDKQRTDPCFFEWPHDKHVLFARIILLKLKRKGLDFPERAIEATGG
jgi:hypothetical protein